MELLVFAAFLAGTWGAGLLSERSHLRALERREQRARSLALTTCESEHDPRHVAAAGLVSGSVVMSLDYFRRLVATLRSLFGGRLTGYERALARARREALLRMQEAAFEAGYREVVGVRIETARLASSTQGGKGTAGIEILAVGTGLRLRR